MIKCEQLVILAGRARSRAEKSYIQLIRASLLFLHVWRASLGMDILNALWSEAVSFLSQGASVV